MVNKNMVSKLKIAVAASMMLISQGLCGQDAVSVGRGSYAAYPPLYKGKTDAHSGDQSTLMQSKKLWVTERDNQPIPTNDWWTGLINAQFADALWSYPAMVHPSANGVTVNYPTYWNENGTEVKPSSYIEVRGVKFTAESAVADTWHDWDVEMKMADAEGKKQMLTTMAHGMPFTWIELTDINPILVMSDTPEFYDAEGNALSERALVAYSDAAIGVKIGDDCYGIYLPEGCSMKYAEKMLTITMPSAGYVVVGLLPTMDHIVDYADYAYAVPRDTKVSWSYDERRGEISSTWSVTAENLMTGDKNEDVIQGFVPHAYKGAKSMDFSFNSDTYLTPRGTMKMTTGREFTITHRFSGMLPWWAAPIADETKANPYRQSVMDYLMQNYADNGTFGGDTYWGGKGLTQMALNMTFAKQTGNEELFVQSRDKLKDVMVNWLTYTPGESNYFFAYYPRWGGMLGFDTSYDSDTFNDHHFHYGYFTLAGALLCMVDEDFKNNYGDMLRLVAKDYANWDREDTRFPFLRNMDPWVGHSYAGGLGDQLNSNGNGQESTSESMQGWGGVYLLGVALGDKEMRDAGIFGWSMEARATREYWFDVDSRFDKYGMGGNFDYTLYQNPYNSNITCKGIGWWTWFGGDPMFMHGIQWMPISPALDYLSWDTDFVKWAYEDMMSGGNTVYSHKWFEDTYQTNDGATIDALAKNDWGNVTLAYMQRALPDEAAAIFDQAYAEGYHIATAVSTGHISYYVIHSHRTYGEIDTDVTADIPTANAFVKDGNYTYIVYNPDSERVVNFYRDGALVKSVKAPKGELVAFTDAPVASRIVIESEAGSKFMTSSQLTAVVYDQYGATVEDATVTWSVDNGSVGSINADGMFTVASGAAKGSTAVVTATYTANGVTVTDTFEVTINEPSVPTTGAVLPDARYIEKGMDTTFSLDVKDQYDEVYEGQIVWTINGNEVVEPYLDAQNVGLYTIAATIGGKTYSHEVFVTPALANLALGKDAYESSHENEGSVVAGLNDGDMGTRWGSAHSDDEWCYIDLGKSAYITSVNIMWEAAFASSYELLLSDNGVDWTSVKTVTGITDSSRQSDRQLINATGRYIKMQGLTRATNYGYSIWEFQVFGIYTDASADDIVGIDILADKEIADEDETITFTANSYKLSGEKVDATVTWSVDAAQGTITAGGVFTPATYGTAVITATTADGMSASRSVMVNEVIKLSSLSVSPSSAQLIVGKTTKFSIVGLNQFGGEYAVDTENLTATVYDASDMTTPTAEASIDLSTMEFRATATGSYVVKFACGKATADATVEVMQLTDVNLALGKPATAGSGDNPTLSNDGDATTRWQAKPGDRQYITIDLEDAYLVDKMVVLWEASLATKYHLEVSMDGELWTTIAYNAEAPTAGVSQTTTFDAVPAQYVRLVGDELNDLATQWGMSPFEIEIYGTEMFSVSNDGVAPEITKAVTTLDDTTLNVEASAIEASGYVFYEVACRENSAVNPLTLTSSAYATSGVEVSFALEGLSAETTYICTITARDAHGNESTYTTEVVVPAVALTGVNLALEKPVTASSVENVGLAAVNVNDGDVATRWSSAHDDGQWIMVDLDACYRVQNIKVNWTDAAYASEYIIETSNDGETWTQLGDNRKLTGTGIDDIAVDDVVMRYVRITGVTRATQYGISIGEIEVYGDAKMLTVVSRDGSNLKLIGQWDDTIFSSIDDASITGYDIMGVSGAPTAIETENPNCLIYTTSAKARAIATNMVVVSGGVATAASIELWSTHAFNALMDIEVSGTVTYHAPSTSTSKAIVLPMAYTAKSGEKAYQLSSITDESVVFNVASTVEANSPMLLDGASSETVTVEGATIVATPKSMVYGAMEGTYEPRQADGELLYDAAQRKFTAVSSGTQISAFEAYLFTGDSDSRVVSLSGLVGLEMIGYSDDDQVNVYTIDGIMVRQGVRASEALEDLSTGVYVVGTAKVYVK